MLKLNLCIQLRHLDMWLKEYWRKGKAKSSILLPESNSDVDKYEYTDADSPYSAKEVENNFWDIVVYESEDGN